MNGLFRINRKNLESKYLPLLIFSVIYLNSILSNYGVNYVYLGVISISIFIYMFGKFNREMFSIFRIYLLFVIFIFSLIVYSAAIGGDLFTALRFMLIYTLPGFFWIVYFSKYSFDDFIELIKKSIPLAYMVAVIGVVQFFLSPDIFGLIEKKSLSINWASEQGFSKYITYFRATSILDSPQVYGLFMALYICIIDTVFKNTNFWNNIGMIFLIFSGLLSGGKVFLLIIVIYFIFNKLNIKTITNLIIISGVIFAVLELTGAVHVLDRMISIDAILQQESGDSRLDRYLHIIENANPLFGEGLGSAEHGITVGFKAAESYVLKIYYETGFFPTALLLLSLIGSAIIKAPTALKGYKTIILLMIFTMFFVHTYESPILLMFWGVIFSLYRYRFDMRSKTKKERAFLPTV